MNAPTPITAEQIRKNLVKMLLEFSVYIPLNITERDGYVSLNLAGKEYRIVSLDGTLSPEPVVGEAVLSKKLNLYIAGSGWNHKLEHVKQAWSVQLEARLPTPGALIRTEMTVQSNHYQPAYCTLMAVTKMINKLNKESPNDTVS